MEENIESSYFYNGTKKYKYNIPGIQFNGPLVNACAYNQLYATLEGNDTKYILDTNKVKIVTVFNNVNSIDIQTYPTI